MCECEYRDSLAYCEECLEEIATDSDENTDEDPNEESGDELSS